MDVGDGGGGFDTRPVDHCSSTSHAGLPSVRKLWGDIWVTAGYEVENQTPPVLWPSAGGCGGGRQDVSACITSRWAPSEAKVSGQITSHNGRDHKRQPQSHAPLHTEGGNVHSRLWRFRVWEGGFMVRTTWVWTLHCFAFHDRTRLVCVKPEIQSDWHPNVSSWSPSAGHKIIAPPPRRFLHCMSGK